MNKAFDKLPALIQEELDASNALHPGFHSAHEGYAVLLEEVEEASEELAILKEDMERMWEGGVRLNSGESVAFWADNALTHAALVAAEAIQAAAMARKILDGVKAGWSA